MYCEIFIVHYAVHLSRYCSDFNTKFGGVLEIVVHEHKLFPCYKTVKCVTTLKYRHRCCHWANSTSWQSYVRLEIENYKPSRVSAYEILKIYLGKNLDVLFNDVEKLLKRTSSLDLLIVRRRKNVVVGRNRSGLIR